MAKKPASTPATEPAQPSAPSQEVVFHCRFCSQDKPLAELVMLRQYYPPLASCQECFRINSNLR